MEGCPDRETRIGLILDSIRRSRLVQQLKKLFLTAAGQGQKALPLLGSADHPGLSIGGKAHGLGPIKIRIGKCGQAQNAVAGPAGQFGGGEVQQVGPHQLHRAAKVQGGQLPPGFLPPGLWFLVRIFLAAEGLYGVLHRFSGNGLQLIEMGPLVGIGAQIFVHKNSVAPLAGLSLQRQGDEISKPPGGQGILAWKHTVV